MKISASKGWAIVLHNGQIKLAMVTQNESGVEFFNKSGLDIACPDYDENFDFYYEGSDDGTILVPTHVIAFSETGPLIPEIYDTPDGQVIFDAANAAITPYLPKLARGEIYASDFEYALKVMGNSAMIQQAYAQHGGDVAEAQQSILHKIFGQ
jgi:hypothetical protein